MEKRPETKREEKGKKGLRPKKLKLGELIEVKGKVSFEKPEIKTQKEITQEDEAKKIEKYLKEKKKYGPPNTSGISTENASIPFMRR